MNLVEKVLARASGSSSVVAGEVVIVEVDAVLLHDLSAYSTGKVFESEVGGLIENPENVVVVFDHLFSPPTEEKAEVLKRNREFCATYGLTLYDCGNGNLHHVATRNGHVRPGAIVVGSDSHSPVHGAMGAVGVSLGNNSCAGTALPFAKSWLRVPEMIVIELIGQPGPGTTPRDVALWLVGQIGEGQANYAALRFDGEYIESLGFWDRWLFPLMAVDVGAKIGFVEPDAETERMARHLGVTDDLLERSDPDPAGTVRWRFDVSGVEPMIAAPPSLGNVFPIRELAGTPVDWCELGGHGGGRAEDFILADTMLAGERKTARVGFNAVPSSRGVLEEMLEAGLVERFHRSGASWFPPSDGSNQTINMGALAAGDHMISTQARNFPGRNGSRDAKMFIASALSVGAAAATGKITDPREML